MFNGARLRQARELRLLTQADLAMRVGKSQAAIANIEGGFGQPSPELAAALAAHIRFPHVFFSTEQPFVFPTESLMFRARAATTRREAAGACRYAEIAHELSHFLAQFVSPIPIRLQKSTQSPTSAAQQVRRQMGIPLDVPIPHVIHEVEKFGVLVLALPLDLERIDAFSAWVGDVSQPLIAICSGRPGDRLRWSVSHELGHLILHSDLKRLKKEHHQEADCFAAEFLLPEEGIRREIVQPVTLGSLANLKPRWGAAIQSLIRRALDLQVISKRQYSYLFEQVSLKGWRKNEPANLDIPIEKPRSLMKMAEVAFGTPIDSDKIAKEAKLSEEIVEAILSGYDMHPSFRDEQQRSSKVITLLKTQN